MIDTNDLFLDAIRNKPVWQLTSDDIDALPPTERQWAINHLHYMKQEGILAIVLANPKGTIYKTVWEDGRWNLVPAPKLDAREAADALRDLIRAEFDSAFKAVVSAVSGTAQQSPQEKP